jgi:hypothetical protein
VSGKSSASLHLLRFEISGGPSWACDCFGKGCRIGGRYSRRFLDPCQMGDLIAHVPTGGRSRAQPIRLIQSGDDRVEIVFLSHEIVEEGAHIVGCHT